MIPDWYILLLLSLAAYRMWKLLAEDTILAPVRARITMSEWERELLECPWCLGAWISLGWVVAWWVFPYQSTVIAVPFVVSALVGLYAQVVEALAG